MPAIAPAATLPDELLYPSTDGEPMASNTEQAEIMTTLYDNLQAMFADREDVFVAIDLFWYPIEGDNKTRVAPDAMVVFGRPKGHRRAYLQFREDNIAPQVVFEIISESNTDKELRRKRRFYQRFGVQEYYVYDPETSQWQGYVRRGKRLRPVANMLGWTSPLLKIRFGQGDGARVLLYKPDGEPFQSFVELKQQALEAKRQAVEERIAREMILRKIRALGIDPDQL